MVLDVLTFGETMLRISPPGQQRLSQLTTCELHVGGSESNTAVGLAKLGLRVGWVSRLTDNPMGRLLCQTISSHGVDTSGVVWTPEDRVGVYYLERGKAPRAAQVYYDRSGSAASRMSWEDFPVNLLVDNPPRIFHTTGITLGIGELTAQTALRAVELAKSLGVRISFDINYRSKLWSQPAARQGIQAVAELADILLLPHRDAVGLYHCAGQDPNADLAALQRLFPNAIIVMTLGAKGACLQYPSGVQYSAPAFPAEEVERLGTGDAFTAGFLYGLLTTNSPSEALRWGNATAAFKYSIPSEFALVDRDEVAALVQGAATGPFIR